MDLSSSDPGLPTATLIPTGGLLSSERKRIWEPAPGGSEDPMGLEGGSGGVLVGRDNSVAGQLCPQPQEAFRDLPPLERRPDPFSTSKASSGATSLGCAQCLGHAEVDAAPPQARLSCCRQARRRRAWVTKSCQDRPALGTHSLARAFSSLGEPDGTERAESRTEQAAWRGGHSLVRRRGLRGGHWPAPAAAPSPAPGEGCAPGQG